MRPSLTACASHVAVTSDSRPEKPPRPATLAPDEMITLDAEDCEETPIVPPPWALGWGRAGVGWVLWPNTPPPPPPAPPPRPRAPGVGVVVPPLWPCVEKP